MSNDVTQSGATNNQSTALYTLRHFLLGNNRTNQVFFNNSLIGDVTLPAFCPVIRDADNGVEILDDPGANAANIIGLSLNEADLLIPAGTSQTLEGNIVSQGIVNEDLINLPGALTLETVVDGLAIRDYLQRLGLHLESGVNNTKPVNS